MQFSSLETPLKVKLEGRLLNINMRRCFIHPRLDEERQDRLSSFWVVAELAPIVLVLANGPHGHLEHASGGEQIRGNALGHHGERQPG